MKELIEKRNALIAEFDKIKGALENEKRSAYTNEEREAVNKIKIELDAIDEQIQNAQAIESKRNFKLDMLATNKQDNNKTEKGNDEFRSFMMKGEGKFTLEQDILKRATVTTSTDSEFVHTNQFKGLSIAENELILDQIGAKTYFFGSDGGKMQFPSIGGLIGVFGTEDNGNSDVSLTSGDKTLEPEFVSASLEVSKKFIASSQAENIADLKNALAFAIHKAVEKRALDSMSGLTAAYTGTSLHTAVVELEKAMVGTPSGYILSAAGVAKAKTTKKDNGSGKFVWEDGGYVNGYPAKRSTLMGNNHIYCVEGSNIVKAFWGDVTIEVVQDATLARKGNVLLIASVLADASYINAAKVAVYKNVTAAS